ncbi:TOMM precursor leader peptide-binding protein [Brevibacillus sp. NRS-1366]|uniref:TOMM precursor leader peptide-binding protein n=1 Tax=Brevibacillus sp. NRS-1366 TaxID=3233899 RepID=UPI003D196CC4
MSADILVMGDGILAETVSEGLLDKYRLVRQPNWTIEIPQADFVLVLNDAWHPSLHLQAEKRFQQSQVPWLRGFVSFGEAIVGPLVRPGVPGCSQCADIRRLMAGRNRKEMWEMQVRLSEEEGVQRDAWVSRTGLLHVAQYVIAEVHRVLEGRQASFSEHIQVIDLKTLTSTRHLFLPDPLCSVCSPVPDDTAERARITLKPRVKPDPRSYRTKTMDDLKKSLKSDYLDARTGFLNGKMRDLVSVFADVSVNLPLFPHDEATAGRTNSYADSELTAILEGLERYCGMTPRGKRTTVHDCYANLAEHALDPTLVGTHTKEQYVQPGYPFREFEPTRPMNWVWGHSFLQERPILVPELLAYYSLGFGEGFVFETSNGCALGGSLEEAIFYGIMEVVERDAFLLTWYAQLPLPRLDPNSADDPELQLMIDRLQIVTDYDLFFYNATMENGIPSVWTIAKNRKQKGLHIVCAGGAHLDPIRAVKGSIHETAAMLFSLNDKFEANREKYKRMFHDPSLVKKMDDHAMLYSLPEAEERLAFLLDESRPIRSFAEEFAWKNRHSDLTDDLRDVLQVFRELNLDVIVVDQTTPEVSRNGLSCVRVLIPGMLPMTFGHHLTRLNGLERVLQVPVTLGYAKEPLRFGQLNPHPHPFP